MARVTGLAGQSQKQVASWSNELLSLGPTLGKTPTELAEALYFVASSGVPAAKAISVVTASAKAAAAGLGETEVVADAVTSVMNAYGTKTMSAVRATNVLVATVREGKGEADQFAGVIGNVAAYASRLKVPFEEVGAALAAMTQLGTDPATAATQLQAFFSQVIRPSGVAIKAAEGVGFSFETLSDTLQKKGLLPALNMVKKEFKGNAGAMAQVFPNIRALRALLALTAEDGGKVAGIFKRMGDSTGSLGTAFGAAEKTASFNMDKFKASIETLKIAFGQGLLPMITNVSKALATKLADPKFVAKVRELGVLVGTNLYKAFVAIGTWFRDNWPTILEGFRIAKRLTQAYLRFARKMVDFWTAAAPVIAGAIQAAFVKPMKFVLAAWSGVLEAMTHIPLIGGKFKGALEAVNAAREAVGTVDAKLTDVRVGGGDNPQPRRGKQKMLGGGYKPGRALGGPAFAGMTYRVGERGPEVLTMGAGSGHISAGGGGGIHISGDLHFHGVQNVRQLISEIQRVGDTNAASRRGRYGGSNLAMG